MDKKSYQRRTPKTLPQMIQLLQKFGWLKRRDPDHGSGRQSLVRRPPMGRRRPRSFSSPWQKWMADGVAFTLLFGGTALIAVSGWFSYQLILNPDVGIWLNQFLPTWTQIPLKRHEAIQTLDEIQAKLEEQGLSMGDPLPLPSAEAINPSDSSGFDLDLGFLKSFLRSKDALVQPSSDILVAVLRKRPGSPAHACQSDCKEVVELRVYKGIDPPYQRLGSPKYFRLASQLEARGPAESYVIAPFISNRMNQQGSNKPLPLTKVSQFVGNVPSEGLWFNLSGERIMGRKLIPYGQVVHYNPAYYHLSRMLEWKSSAGQQPVWQQVTGSLEPELLVEETIGLEPQFEVYQVKPQKFVPNPVKLDGIPLDEEVIDNSSYRQALRMARSGLWSPALELITPVHQNMAQDSPSQWPALAQSQFDLIQFHARITQAQALAAWASPSQKVLAGLIDGRWTETLNMVQNQEINPQEINDLLQADDGRLKTRIQTALLENPDEPDLQAWGALVVAAQAGQAEAINWLNQQPKASSETKTRIRKLLN
ncbi:MAG: hypothetical protein HC825_02740 [Oscillatoriales cyanobacterium RM1_1_9]|nr:hypothetical protein [Oscillatoriales cyanobacterium SM2_3_0]NJO46944.1 hypothetical protein [Oscillatoriales cyanobacterium RM2_1_1]NJO70902.1 hypothetical protein [Oscillatoriales cyanobacterium RM1_1_9]